MLIDCKCQVNTLNEGKQDARLVQKLQNPQVLEFVGIRADGVYVGSVTKVRYRFGDSTKYQCVDERDVTELLKLSRNRRKLFQVVKNPQDLPPMKTSVKMRESGGQITRLTLSDIMVQKIVEPNDSDVDLGEVAPETDNLVPPEPITAELEALTGIGAGTAKALADAGYTRLSLSLLEQSEAESVAANAAISKAMAAKAILASKA